MTNLLVISHVSPFFKQQQQQQQQDKKKKTLQVITLCYKPSKHIKRKNSVVFMLHWFDRSRILCSRLWYVPFTLLWLSYGPLLLCIHCTIIANIGHRKNPTTKVRSITSKFSIRFHAFFSFICIIYMYIAFYFCTVYIRTFIRLKLLLKSSVLHCTCLACWDYVYVQKLETMRICI